MSEPRVRFAPSPTGHLHVGGARTALFNWLFARREGGVFVLRIEDTDRERSSEAMTRAILDALAWLGLEVDEGPHHQADGVERHRVDVARLVERGAAYPCFCAAEADGAEGRDGTQGGGAAGARRQEAAGAQGQEAAGTRPGAAVGGCAGGCRELDREEAARRRAEREPHAVRFAVPREGETAWEDAVHGRTAFPNDSLEDFVLLREDGSPVYNLAVVSDDLAMRITHVLRGDDHLSNTPKQILLYRALGQEPPVFGHLPMILGPDGRRLSKRHGAASVEAFREEGILPEAMVNFLALLGWSPGDDREIMTREELIEAFRLERVLRKSSVFDAEKLRWLNGQHISRATPERLLEPALERLEARGMERERVLAERERFLDVLEAVKDRTRTVEELARQAEPFFLERVDYDPEAVERFWKDPAAAAERLEALEGLLRGVEAWEAGPLEEALRGLAASREEGAGKLIHPLRVALMGVGVGPGIFTILVLMGRERTLERIGRALERLRQGTAAG